MDERLADRGSHGDEKHSLASGLQPLPATRIARLDDARGVRANPGSQPSREASWELGSYRPTPKREVPRWGTSHSVLLRGYGIAVISCDRSKPEAVFHRASTVAGMLGGSQKSIVASERPLPMSSILPFVRVAVATSWPSTYTYASSRSSSLSRIVILARGAPLGCNRPVRAQITCPSVSRKVKFGGAGSPLANESTRASRS